MGMLSIGALVGAMISGPISSWIGRRIGMIIGCAIFFIGTTIQISAVESWIQMTVGRAICGISVGMMSGKLSPQTTFPSAQIPSLTHE